MMRDFSPGAKELLMQIFSDVQQVDTRYIGTVAGLVTAGNAIITYFLWINDGVKFFL